MTKFSQILLLYSEAINTVFYFCEDSRYFCLSNVSPVRWKKKPLLSQAANPERTIGVKQSHHHISHNTTRQIKDFANAAWLNQESAAGSTRCDGDWLQRSLCWIESDIHPETTHRDIVFVYIVEKIKYSFRYLPRQPWWLCFISLPTVINRKSLSPLRHSGPILPQLIRQLRIICRQ